MERLTAEGRLMLWPDERDCHTPRYPRRAGPLAPASRYRPDPLPGARRLAAVFQADNSRRPNLRTPGPNALSLADLQLARLGRGDRTGMSP
jgi:hypothetical protein